MKKYVLALGGSFLFALSSVALADVTVFNNSSSGVCITNVYIGSTIFLAPHDKLFLSVPVTAATFVSSTTGDNCTDFPTGALGLCANATKIKIQGKDNNLKFTCIR